MRLHPKSAGWRGLPWSTQGLTHAHTYIHTSYMAKTLNREAGNKGLWPGWQGREQEERKLLVSQCTLPPQSPRDSLTAAPCPESRAASGPENSRQEQQSKEDGGSLGDSHK